MFANTMKIFILRTTTVSVHFKVHKRALLCFHVHSLSSLHSNIDGNIEAKVTSHPLPTTQSASFVVAHYEPERVLLVCFHKHNKKLLLDNTIHESSHALPLLEISVSFVIR